MTALLITLFFACGDKEEKDSALTEPTTEPVEETTEEQQEPQDTWSTEETPQDTGTTSEFKSNEDLGVCYETDSEVL